MATLGKLTIISDDNFDHDCTVCERQGKVTKSGVFCLECQTYLCADCLSTHNIFCIGHHVLKTTDEKVQNILTERCEKHPDKVTEFYCRNHDEVVCTICYWLNHKKCDDVKHISESVAELSADPVIQAIPGQIQSALDQVNQIIKTFENHIKQIKKEKDKVLKDLEEFAKSILSKIEEMRKRGKDDITASHQHISSKANEKLNACLQAKDDLSKHLDEIKQSTKRTAHLIVLKHCSKKIAIQTETLCNESKKMIKETALCFRRNNKLSNLLAGFNSLLEESNDPMEQRKLFTEEDMIDHNRWTLDASSRFHTDKEEMVHGSFSQPQDEKPSSRRQFGVSNSDEIRIKNQPAYFEPIKSPLSQPQGEVSIPQQQVQGHFSQPQGEVSIPQQQVQGHFSQPQRWSPCPQQQEISPASPVPIKFDWEYEEEPF